MSEAVLLSGRDYDVWQLATPLQLLHLLRRLRVESKVIAAQIGVQPPAISMWLRGKRRIPPHYHPALLTWTQIAFEQAVRRLDKEVAAQPTEALQRATQEIFQAVWRQWKLEVLLNVGTFQKALQYEYQGLGAWVMKETLTVEDYDTIDTVLESMKGKVRLLRAQAQAQASESSEGCKQEE